uniref:non-specific serine/threonine protein kinase n=1 Tax=Culex pipiens TaxID=7175 RepID=A0A8D8B9X7_CULPI
MSWGRIYGLLLLLAVQLAAGTEDALEGAASRQRNEDCTAVVPAEETLLVFSTLGGGLTAIDPMTGETRWSIADEPAIRVPSLSEMNPHYLPDPRDGSLYTIRNPEGGLKKLPYTIPQLVASAPCRSSDGILYSGKKSDDWFLIDPKTGRREKVLGFGAPLDGDKAESIGWATSRAVYLGRTQYTVMMYDSQATGRNSKPWNVTFFDYTSHTMAPELTKDYEFLHLTSSSSGLTATFEQKKGIPLWQKDVASPVVAVFLLGSEGLLSVPFQTVSDEVLQEINERAQDGNNFDNLKLFPTVYVGESSNNIYAIPSLVDKNTATLPSEPTVNLLGGPNRRDDPELQPGHELIAAESARVQNDNIIILGHYQPPKTDESLKLDISPGSPGRFYKDGGLSTVRLELNGGLQKDGKNTKTIGVQTDQLNGTSSSTTALKEDVSLRTLFTKLYMDVKLWLDAQPNKLPTMMFVALFGVVVFGFWYFHMQMKALQEQSQNGSQTNSNRSTGSNCVEAIDFGDGEIRVGKIHFNTSHVLGKGCEGTFVFRGTFEKRDVAVKRILPGCFTLADREVTLLRESDKHSHENVVRYFCTEQDRQFWYIAVELCAATLQDYVDPKSTDTFQKQISVQEILCQATSGLMHLHSIDIVHRDIKPQNILLSLPDNKKRVRAMISDFGLCKKLNYGKASFSRRSGVTGTDGWIAPEMQRGHRTTTSVDIFSLGCVFYYVMTRGQHPFGDNLKRQANILSGEFDLRGLHKERKVTHVSVLAEELIGAMIANDQSKRPPAAAVRNHPLFWDNETILGFLQNVSDRVEKSDIMQQPLRALERNARLVVREDWSLHLDQEITADLRKYRGYQGFSVRDLMRALRNKKHHYHELTSDVQQALGTIPDGFTCYWTGRFPHLLSHAFHALADCSQESIFTRYYNDCVGYRFPRPAYFDEEANDNHELIRYYEGAQKAKATQSPKRKPGTGTTASSAEDSPLKNNRRGAYNFGKYANTGFITREQMMGGSAVNPAAVTAGEGEEEGVEGGAEKDDFVTVVNHNHNNRKRFNNNNNHGVRRRENVKVTWNLNPQQAASE